MQYIILEAIHWTPPPDWMVHTFFHNNAFLGGRDDFFYDYRLYP